MTNNINRLGFNITGYNYARQEEAAAQSAPEQKSKSDVKENKQLGANDILSYMAAANTDLIPAKTQRTVDVNKYVTPEQAERIGAFVKGFEADFDEAAIAAVNEFGVSEKVADKIALAYINASY